ncbi:MAG: hypothetical protein ACHQ49_08800 [Elusimicrobiota bacterium]
MNIGRTILAAAVAAAVSGCSTPKPKQEAAKTSPAPRLESLGDSLKQMEQLSAELKAAPPAIPVLPAALAPSVLALEPARCTAYVGTGRPDLEAESLNCITGWMREAQDYLARGGTPTKYTNPDVFEKERKIALELQARQAKWLAEAKWEARIDPAIPVVASRDAGFQSSQQRYLEGVISFQKGDYIKARAAWSDALKLDPSNADAQAGLSLLDKTQR